MRRGQIVFVTAVFTALVTAWLVSRSESRELVDFRALVPPVAREFTPLEPPTGPHAIEGRVLGPDGEPAAEVSVHVLRRAVPTTRAEPMHWDATDADGRFHVGALEAGTYEVALLRPGFPTSRRTVQVPLPAAVEWRLPAALEPIRVLPEIVRVELRGRVEAPEEAADLPLADLAVQLRPVSSTDPLSGAVQRHVTTDAEGVFAIPDLVGAEYEVLVLPSWAAGGTWPVLARNRILHPPEHTPSAVLLRLEIGAVTGRIIDPDGRPIAGALVQVRPRDENGHVWPPESTGDDGAFRLRELPPGVYALDVRAGSGRWSRDASVEVGKTTALPEVVLDPHGG